MDDQKADSSGSTVPPLITGSKPNTESTTSTPLLPSQSPETVSSTPSQPIAPNQNQASAETQTKKSGPGAFKTVLVILLLIIFYPIGVTLMLVWMKWSIWVKIVIVVALILGILAYVTFLFLSIDIL